MGKGKNTESKAIKTQQKQLEKQRKAKRNTIITVIAVVLIAAGITTTAILSVTLNPVNTVKGAWSSVSAVVTATGETADLKEIYNVYYSNYTGSLTLNEDGTFSFYMTVGEDTGNNNGTYTVTDHTIHGVFESGAKAEFTFVPGAHREADAIKAPYGEYTITFHRSKNQ